MDICEKIINIKKSSLENKKEIIKENLDDHKLMLLLYYILNPYLIPPVDIDKIKDCDISKEKQLPYRDIFECLDKISIYSCIDNATLRRIKAFLNSCNGKERYVYQKLLTKTLNLGITSKIVNQIAPNTMPEWRVQMPSSSEKLFLREEKFWITPNIFGVRGTFYNKIMVGLNGLNISLPKKINDELRFIDYAGFVVDGYLHLSDEVCKECNIKNFREYKRVLFKMLKDENPNKRLVLYSILDIIPKKDFDSTKPTTDYQIRRTILNQLSSFLVENNAKFVDVVPAIYEGQSIDEAQEKINEFKNKNNLCSFLLYKNSPYIRDKNDNVLII